MVIEYHDKTIYDCKNVTKRHCTTLWTVNDLGEKVIILVTTTYFYLASYGAGMGW